MARLVDSDGREVPADSEITDWLGDVWTFKRIALLPDGHHTGKVEAERNNWAREFYPSVFPGYRIEA